MVAISKLFDETLKNCDCNDFVHPNGCFYNALYSVYRFTLSNTIYFAPVVFMPLLLKIKKLNSDLLRDTIKYYLEVVFCGTITGSTIQWMICLIRNLLGEFRMQTSIYVPSMLGGLATLLVGTKRAQHLFFTSMIQCAIETLLIKRKNPITKLVARSLSIQTFVFMCCSALILHAKRHNKFKGFWFLIPNTKMQSHNQQSMQGKVDNNEIARDTSSSSPYCTHGENSCDLHLIKGIRNYIVIGLTLDTIKMLMNKAPIPAVGFFRKVLAKLSTCSLRTTSFMASYIGIYRFLHCYFNRKTSCDQESNHILAAFFGGVAFILYPKLTLQCYGLVLSLEILHKMLTTFQTDKSSTVLKYIQRLPLMHILYLLCLSSQIQTYVLREHYTGPMAATIINGVTDNHAKRIQIKIRSIERSL